MATNSDQNVTPPHSHPLQKWILFGLVFIGVPLMIYFGYLIKGKTELQKVQKEYKATGYPITLQELDDWYPTPKGENAADLYLLAYTQMVEYPDWDPGKEILSAFERKTVKEEVMPGEAMMPGDFSDDLPEERSSADVEQDSDLKNNTEEDSDNAPPNLENDRQLAKRILPLIGEGKMPKLGERIDLATLALTKSYVQANHQAIATLYKAMTIKESRYPLDLTQGFDALGDYYGSLRHEAHLLALQTLVESHANHPNKATQSLLAIYALARSLEREPLSISYLVNIATLDIALSETERTLNLIPLSNNDLVQLSNEIDALLKSDGLFRATVGEYVIGNALFEGNDMLDFEESTLKLWKNSGLFDRDHATYLNIMLSYIRASQLPTMQKISEFKRIDSEHDTLPKTLKITPLILPSMGRALIIEERMFAKAIIQKVGLAVERYRLKHNKLPEKLADLTPEFLEKLPDDPFTGKSVIYKKFDGGGYMIYSTGQDKTDDGGRWKNSAGYYFDPGSDICFEVRR